MSAREPTVRAGRTSTRQLNDQQHLSSDWRVCDLLLLIFSLFFFFRWGGAMETPRWLLSARTTVGRKFDANNILYIPYTRRTRKTMSYTHCILCVAQESLLPFLFLFKLDCGTHRVCVYCVRCLVDNVDGAHQTLNAP